MRRLLDTHRADVVYDQVRDARQMDGYGKSAQLQATLRTYSVAPGTTMPHTAVAGLNIKPRLGINLSFSVQPGSGLPQSKVTLIQDSTTTRDATPVLLITVIL